MASFFTFCIVLYSLDNLIYDEGLVEGFSSIAVFFNFLRFILEFLVFLGSSRSLLNVVSLVISAESFYMSMVSTVCGIAGALLIFSYVSCSYDMSARSKVEECMLETC